jgi:indole-3-glycerol phosphate synthase
MTILDTIANYKLSEVATNKELHPIQSLEKSVYFKRMPISFTEAVKDKSRHGIIAEFKRSSPSKGVINSTAKVEQTTLGYFKAGASVLSVLTDSKFFGGSNADLIKAREVNSCPILRKDFIVDEYQILEAKSIGADVILLIAAILTPKEIKALASFAKTLGLSILLEVHDKDELERSTNEYIDVVGVNNRNLKDFTVDLHKSFELSSLIPPDFLKISESAIGTAKTVHELKEAGYDGFLIGETFMKEKLPEEAMAAFVSEIKNYKNL